MLQQAADPAFLDAPGFEAYIKKELVRWSAAVTKAGVKLD